MVAGSRRDAAAASLPLRRRVLREHASGAAVRTAGAAGAGDGGDGRRESHPADAEP